MGSLTGTQTWNRTFAILGATLLFLFSLAQSRGKADNVERIAAAFNAPVPASLFGMHIHRAASTTAWPGVPFAEQRLWDIGATWHDLEPRRGDWQWGALDPILKLDAEHHVEPMLTLGMTPTWAASRTTEKSAYGDGAASPPASLDDWKRYVSAVVKHCGPRVSVYELWNEPNFATFYTGTAQQLADLARVGYTAIKTANPTAIVATPAFSLEDESGFAGLDRFLAAGGGAYADVIAVHLYVGKGSPEDHVRQTARLRDLLARYHLSAKPLWNTEMGWPRAKTFASDAEAAGYVARTYLLDWALGFQRVYWYAWDNTEWVSLTMVAKDQKTPTAAAHVYAAIQPWMIGWRLDSCASEAGAWHCEMTQVSRPVRGQVATGQVAHIVWAERGVVSYTVPNAWHATVAEDLDGGKHAFAGKRLEIGPTPLRLLGAHNAGDQTQSKPGRS